MRAYFVEFTFFTVELRDTRVEELVRMSEERLPKHKEGLSERNSNTNRLRVKGKG